MINNPVDFAIPFLWGAEHFKKSNWGFINYIVGPNGTGKSLIAEQLKHHFNNRGYRARYLNAERLLGFEKSGVSHFGGGSLRTGFNISEFAGYKNSAEAGGLSSSAIIILKERLDIRLKIEALLSDIFGKTIRLAEEGGYLKPKMQNLRGGNQYNLTESECHGLKELITLLTFLYDSSHGCLILDEPELHLHPQFQAFFLQEIRKVAGNPLVDSSKKLFFIITHSPYFIDLRSTDDLKNVLVCQLGKLPTSIDVLTEDEQYVLKKFLPRFNTHHKQFFFSPNPVFVEGYTDQQVTTLLLEKTGVNIAAAGSCVIDVGGKDELAVFYTLCKSLNINCRIIADLDAMFTGKLRSVVCDDERSKEYVQKHGLGTNLSNEIGDLQKKLTEIMGSIKACETDVPSIIHLKSKLSILGGGEMDAARIAVLMSILRYTEDIRTVLDETNGANLNLVLGRVNQIHNAFKACNVFVFPKGEIEHYYVNSAVDYLNIANKDRLFHSERDYILSAEDSELLFKYEEVFLFLSGIVPIIEIEIRKHLKFEVFEWIHNVQTAIARGEVNDIEDVKRNARINYNLYKQILTLDSLKINKDKSFTGAISIQESLVTPSVTITFDQNTTAYTFSIN